MYSLSCTPKIVFILLIYFISSVTCERASCTYKEYNLSQIGSREWLVITESKNVTFQLSICGDTHASSSCPTTQTVCPAKQQSATPTTEGFIEDKKIKELRLVQKCRKRSSLTGNLQDIQITFKCGQHLGSPEYIESNGCVHYFEWYTYLVCSDAPKEREVVCSVHDSANNKYDLSQLIMTVGAERVNALGDRDIYINVCRGITPGTSLLGCRGSGACLKQRGKYVNLGKARDKLRIVSHQRLELVYKGGDKPSGCGSNSSTLIVFVCPARGHSQAPLLVSDTDCQYVIEWRTEHACPVSYLTSHTCHLNSEDHDIDIDLSPLALKPGSKDMYAVTVDDPGSSDHFTFYINVCKDVGMECPDVDHKQGMSGCQVKKQSTLAWSIGRTSSLLLRYTDGELSLTYRGGDICHKNVRRSTVITFHCNKAAGRGRPTFNHRSDCTYMFDWETSHACPDHPADNCQVTHGTQHFDLSPLVRTAGKNWAASKADTSDKSRYYINVCHDLVTHPSTKSCPSDSSVCRIGDSKSESLGHFTTPPVYNERQGLIQLNYSSDTPCDAGYKSSRINFICKPGSLETAPVFVRKTGCVSEFVWQTAAGCAVSRHTGTNCVVHDPQAGYRFDLSHLARPTKDPYKITDKKGGYYYYINICAPVTGTECDDRANAGSCQVKITSDVSSHQHANTGEYNTNLTYYDGMITMTYMDGDAYHTLNSKPIKRRTQIAFLCDQSAGIGSPVFIEERDYVYYIQWFTVYACLGPSVACTVNDESTHEEYDLSSLTQHDGDTNWQVIQRTALGETFTKFYINVCRPLTGGVPCGRNAAACAVSEPSRKKYVKLGEARHGPTVKAPGHLLLEYTDGAACTDADGKAVNITSRIHLICSHASMASSPRLETNTSCVYSFVWTTSAACPHNSNRALHNSSKCRLHDVVTGYTYDFSPLSKKDSAVYEVTAAGRTFKLDICSPIPEVTCPKVAGSNKPSSACEVIKNKPVGLGEWSDEVKVTDMGGMYLLYEGPRSGLARANVRIDFVCNRSVPLGQPQYVRHIEQTLEFSFHTSLACPPHPVDCTVQDTAGEQYDLSTLAKSGPDSWIVEDHVKGDVKATFHINVCRQLDFHGHATCSGGSAACATTPAGDINLGYIQSTPVVSAPGVLSLHYRNGSPCQNKNEDRSSTTINFDCATDKEYGPVFVEKTPSCEYVFLWRTPAACPVHRNTGTGCKVKDVLYGLEFDLSPLTRKGTDYTVKSGNSEFLLNVCSPLANGKGDCASGNVGACEVKLKGDSIQSIGLANSSLTYEDGEITVTYGKGHAKVRGIPCITKVVFKCDHSVSGEKGPNFISQSSSCVYLFEWPTRLACPSHTEVDCKVLDAAGEEYDLSGLIQPRGNYEVVTSTPPGQRYIVNVCRTLVHRPGQTCPIHSAACQINTTEPDPHKRYRNIGEIGRSILSASKNRILLTYTNGDVCTNGQRSSTVLHLKCNKLAIDTQPSNEYAVDNCTFHIMWETRAACPLSEVATNNGSCRAKNYATGYVFDLSSLKSRVFNVTVSSYLYSLRVCAPLTQDLCKDAPHSGMCQHELGHSQRDFSGGDANDLLEYSHNALFLKYSHGTPYHNAAKTPRQTLINFVCRNESGDGKPVFIKESNFIYFFLWHTQLACEHQVRCAVDNGSHVIDLSPLIKLSGHHLAIPSFWGTGDKGATYYINICRPLNPIGGVLCPAGSSACRVLEGNKPRDLGKSDSPPYIDKDTGHVTLDLTNGGPCVHRKNTDTRTKIIFTCAPGSSLGMPVLESNTQACTYVFRWATNVVCPVSKERAAINCTYTDTRTTQVYDLSELTKHGGHYQMNWNNKRSFHLNVCGTVSSSHEACRGAAVCEIDGDKRRSLGLADTATFHMEGGTLALTYTGGEPCRGTHKTKTTFYFKCARDSGIKIEPGYAESCRMTFYWWIPNVCDIETRPCVFTDGANVFDLSALSRDDGHWEVTDKHQNRYLLNVCAGVRTTVQGCDTVDAVCRVRHDSKFSDSLGKLDSQSFVPDDKLTTTVISSFYGSHGLPAGRSGASLNKNKYHREFRVRATDHDGVIRDDSSGATFNLARLMSMINGNVFVETRVYRYALNLRGRLVLDPRVGAVCKGAVICEQKVQDTTYHRNIAAYDSREYFVEDNELQVEYRGSDTCNAGKSRIESVIRFTCGPQIQPIEKQVTLDYVSRNKCFYVFEWSTAAVCDKSHSERGNTSSIQRTEKTPSVHQTAPPSRHNVALIAVLTTFSIVLVVILAIVFRKNERRRWLLFKLRMTFCRYKETKMQYTILADAEVTGDSLNPFHDDSDDDILS